MKTSVVTGGARFWFVGKVSIVFKIAHREEN